MQRPRVSSETGAVEDEDYIPYVPVKERKKAEVCWCLLSLFISRAAGLADNEAGESKLACPLALDFCVLGVHTK